MQKIGQVIVKAIHLKCERDENGFLKNLKIINRGGILYDSGNWDMHVSEAESLVGGWLYLHPAKKKLSEYGGKIVSWQKIVDEDKAHSERVVFKFEAKKQAQGKKWRGKNHTMAWQSGVVEADYDHEK